MTGTLIKGDQASILLRDGEVLDGIRTPVSQGNVCTYCDKPILEGWFYWEADGSTLDELTGPFPSWRHADGTEGHGERFHDNDHGFISPKNRCPQCEGFDLSYRDTGYGTVITCPCGYDKYHDRGD